MIATNLILALRNISALKFVAPDCSQLSIKGREDDWPLHNFKTPSASEGWAGCGSGRMGARPKTKIAMSE
jgi:hypothetical protein